ncbi:uncharacterized protein LOC144162764 [Haemaphysalis longicornis]
MTSYRLAAFLATAVFLIAVASAKVTEKPERLDFNATDVRASDYFDTVKAGAGAIIIKGLAKGVIVAIVAGVIGALTFIISCCVYCCKECAQKEETQETQTVVYTAAPEQQQFPVGLQQWPPVGHPTQPPQASAPPYSPPYAPPYVPPYAQPYPPPYPTNQGPPVHQRY